MSASSTTVARAVAASLATLMVLFQGVSAQGGAPMPGGAGTDAPMAELPVTRVVLFTSGVAFFEHTGTVTDTQELEFAVPSQHMDDLLQSLVLEDHGGGTIEPVRYGSRDPLARVLASYSLDFSGDPTLADLLGQARGEAVWIEAAQTIDGVIVNVERVAHPTESTRVFLTVSTGGALRRVPLDEVRELRFERSELQSELEAALAAIARHRGSEQSAVRLRFAGDGERSVRVGYLREMPVWKTTYRLVLHDDGSADLQAWAIFDNPTDLDLIEVQVSFVAGMPVSFVAELFEPVYVRRPRVETATAPGLAPPPAAADVAPAPPAAARTLVPEAAAEAPAPMLADAGVSAMATGERAGASFAYHVDAPVTVARHESALVPIVIARVEAPRLSFYDASVLPAHPLHAVRLVNDTDAHLAAGPVALFDRGGFAGSALLGDVAAGDTRLLSFAVDQDIEVVRSSSSEAERVTAVRIRGGVIESEHRQRFVTEYRLLARPGVERFVVIEHPRREGYQLVAPGPAPAETATSLRFGVALVGDADSAPTGGDAIVPTQQVCPGGAPCLFEVVVERVEARRVAVANVTSELLAFYLENVEMSDADQAVLEQVLDLQQRIAAVQRSLAAERARIDAVSQDQNRIRQNMAALERTSSLYQRYVADLEAQEDELVGVRERMSLLETARDELRRELDELVARLADTASR